MKAVLQRVSRASCTIDKKVVSQIGHGFCIFVGFCEDDTKETVEKMVKKIIKCRVFDDGNGKMNLSIQDVHGEILSISQFTLYANCKKGNRPSFVKAARPEISNPLYVFFNEQIREWNVPVQTGVFQADMKIDLTNDGPVTIIMDDKEL